MNEFNEFNHEPARDQASDVIAMTLRCFESYFARCFTQPQNFEQDQNYSHDVQICLGNHPELGLVWKYSFDSEV